MMGVWVKSFCLIHFFGLAVSGCANSITKLANNLEEPYPPDFSEREAVLLPIHESIIIYEENEEGEMVRSFPPPVRTGRFAGLKVYVKAKPGTDELYVPENLEEAVVELRAMLPPEYLAFILKSFWYVPENKGYRENSNYNYNFDNRIVDLAAFLHWNWYLNDNERLLTKQIYCIGHFELDITSLILGLVTYEIENYGGSITGDMNTAKFLNNRLWYNCLNQYQSPPLTITQKNPFEYISNCANVNRGGCRPPF